jgi:hypothetical protein
MGIGIQSVSLGLIIQVPPEEDEKVIHLSLEELNEALAAT